MRGLRRLVAVAVILLASSRAIAATPLLLYKMDQASSGTTPTTVTDTSTGTAVNPTINYGSTGAWTSITAGKGQNFDSTSGDKTGSLSGTKVATALAGATHASIEVVADTTANPGFGEMLGFESNAFDEILTLSTGNASFGTKVVNLNLNNTVIVAVPATLGLHHFLAVVDTTQATAALRAIIYVDGTAPTPSTTAYPAQNATIDAGFTNYANDRIAIGCLTNAGTQEFIGPIYFAALYATTLTSTDATAHSTALLSNNDADPNVVAGPTTYVIRAIPAFFGATP